MLPIKSFQDDAALNQYLPDVIEALGKIKFDEIAEICSAIELASVPGDGVVWVIGNGGSKANTEHLVLHLRQSGFAAIDMLADGAWLTAESNDTSFDKAVSRNVWPRPSTVIVLSGSGHSPNLFATIKSAKQANSKVVVIGLLGQIAQRNGGRVVEQCDHAIVVESQDYGVVEDVHSALLHFIQRALTT
jgi:D-sedoheptulose 7-phosphate isomerase